MENALFVESAKRFEAECTSDRDRPDVRKALHGQDPCLDILWNNRTRDFHVVVRVLPGYGPHPRGYPVELFGCGTDPRPDDLVSECRRRSLRGRAREFSREVIKGIDAEKARAEKALVDGFLPGFGEYAARLNRCDDEGVARGLVNDMAKEARRA